MGKIIQVVPRRIIQIAVGTMGVEGTLQPVLMVLADDHTAWWRDSPKSPWHQVEGLPDAEACAAVSPGIDGQCQLAKDHRGKQHWNGTRSYK